MRLLLAARCLIHHSYKICCYCSDAPTGRPGCSAVLLPSRASETSSDEELASSEEVSSCFEF
jgi:hypothetical protein